MKDVLLRSLTTIILLGMIAGCSSSPTKSSQVSEHGAQEEGADETAPSPEMSRGSTDKDPMTEASGVKLPKKYHDLASAVRSGKSNQLMEEAGKILASDSTDPVALNALALYQLRKGRVGAAKLLLMRAIEKNPPTASLMNNLGVILLEEGETAAAIAHFKKALSLDDTHVEAAGNLGSLYVQGGDLGRAQPLLEQAYKRNRANPSIATNYAITLRASGNYEGARKIYDDLIRANSKDVAIHLNYAILLIDYMNKPKDGLPLVYKVKFLETERKDVLARANALEKKAKSELK